MTEQLKEIGTRLSMLRESQDLSAKDAASKLEIPLQEYLEYEAGQKDFSFSFLYNAASMLGVDVLDLMSGESPKLSECCLVRKGGGYEINRRAAYSYKHLAFTFRDKKAEPFMVTVEPKDEQPALHAHDGQEFNYMVSGRMNLYIGDSVYELEPGDSAYFNSAIPHAMKALDLKSATFLAVVMR